jgi:hypothetical protein
VGSARGRLFNFDFPFDLGHFESLASSHFCSSLIYRASNHCPNKDDQDREMPDGYYSG